MARTKPADERRSEMLDAAEELIVRTGIDAFTIDDVTTGASVAKGTFYLHFANKSDLIGALRERWVRRFVDAQMTAAQHATGRDKVEQWLRAGVAEYLREVRLHDVLFHPAGAGRDTPNYAVEALAELLTELTPTVPDPTAMAVILYSAMHGVTDHVVHSPEDEQRMIDALIGTARAVMAY